MREHAGFFHDNSKAHCQPLAALLLDVPPIATADVKESATSSADAKESATSSADDSEWESAMSSADDLEWVWAKSSGDGSVWEWAMSSADAAELESAMSSDVVAVWAWEAWGQVWAQERAVGSAALGQEMAALRCKIGSNPIGHTLRHRQCPCRNFDCPSMWPQRRSTVRQTFAPEGHHCHHCTPAGLWDP